MAATWRDLRCASIPEEGLSALADLRSEQGVRVVIERGRAWITWDDGRTSEETRRLLVGRLLPMPGSEVFSYRNGRWHRPGERLPAFDVPAVAGIEAIGLERAILPQPLEIAPPDRDPPRPVALRLVRDDGQVARPAAAMLCRLGALIEWADTAPSAWIRSISGAWCPSDEGATIETEVFVLVPTSTAACAGELPPGMRGLPAVKGTRYWGDDVLIPLGFRAEPDLSGPALRQVVGAGDAHVVVLDPEGPELIPRAAFRTLSRAGIRLAGRRIGGRAS